MKYTMSRFEVIDNFLKEEEWLGLFNTVYSKDFTMMNTDKFVVPENHYFFMGDNRDCSRDSRFLSSVGYVHINNLVGKARLIFFSNDLIISSAISFSLTDASTAITKKQQ